MPHETSVQPKLDDLLSRYLNRQAQAHASGLVSETTDEVVPYEAGPVQPIDAKTAWEEALVAVRFYHEGADLGNFQAPPSWPQLVAAHEPLVALPFCIGNFPQLVRNFHILLQKSNLSELRPTAGRTTSAPALADWAPSLFKKKLYPQALLALGALRLGKQFDLAGDLIRKHDSEVPISWQPAWANEKAALAWHEGKSEEALKLWQAKEPSVPVLFNRGMAELFHGRKSAARPLLTQAIAELPETGAWHHLGRLYLTLTQT